MEGVMKNVLVLVHDDGGQEARVQAALDLVRTFDGHLTCLDIEATPVVMADYATTAGSMNFVFDEHDRSVGNRSHLENRLRHEDVPWDWVHETGDIEDILCHRIDLSDIIVLNSNVDDQNLTQARATVSATAVKTRKPVLAVPADHKHFRAAGLAMIAWDGSPPALAALRAATPLLQKAKSVVLVEIDHPHDHGISAEDGAAYLSRHGVHAAIRRENTHGMMTSSSKLIEIAETMKADYVVMGAYGHSRLTEAVFGGVTRSMLLRSTVPLILVHG
jgi:nucleotide-binding universal stress UspA family protein